MTISDNHAASQRNGPFDQARHHSKGRQPELIVMDRNCGNPNRDNAGIGDLLDELESSRHREPTFSPAETTQLAAQELIRKAECEVDDELNPRADLLGFSVSERTASIARMGLIAAGGFGILAAVLLFMLRLGNSPNYVHRTNVDTAFRNASTTHFLTLRGVADMPQEFVIRSEFLQSHSDFTDTVARYVELPSAVRRTKVEVVNVVQRELGVARAKARHAVSKVSITGMIRARDGRDQSFAVRWSKKRGFEEVTVDGNSVPESWIR